jgi:hypothetical protein
MTLSTLAKRVRALVKGAKATRAKKAKKTSRKTATQKAVARMSKEQKYVDNVAETITVGNDLGANAVKHLDVVKQDTSVSGRIGKNFKIRSCHIRGTISSGTSTVASTYRLSLVWDSAPNKLKAGLGDIYTDATPHAFLNRNNESRFTELHVWYDTVKGAYAAPDALQKLIIIDRRVELASKGLYAMCTSGDSNGTIDGRIAGALYLVMTSTEAAGASAPVLSYVCRIEFDDA